MRFSTIGRACILMSALAGCGSSGNGGSGTTAHVLGGSSGPFSATGSPGIFSVGADNGDLTGTFDNAGSFSGQGSPGVFSATGGDTSACAAVCARIASLQCATDNPPQPVQGDVNGSSDNTGTDAADSCEQDCLAAFAQLNDCERSLLTAYLNCLMTAPLTCRNGQARATSCAQPSESECTTPATISTGTVNTRPPTVIDGGVVDGGA
jgi:hypothetical protein